MKTVILFIFFSASVYAEEPISCDVHVNAMGGEITSSNNYGAMDNNGLSVGRHGTSYSTIPDEKSGAGKTGMNSREEWLNSIIKLPIYLPFSSPYKTRVAAGWFYKADKRHNAVDFAPVGTATFLVQAVADGEVIWNSYSPSAGNVVIIEHTATDGKKFRSIYHHLRDGRDRDIRRARLTEAYSIKYKKFLKDEDKAKVKTYQKQADTDFKNLSSPNPSAEMLSAANEYWGNVNDRIQVQVGSKVKAGQIIAYAGRTGIHQNGVHLHLMFAKGAMYASSSGLSSKRWTFFDPFGFYALNKKCYPTDDTAATQKNFTNHFAPVYQNYIDLDKVTFLNAFKYFSKRGFGPATFSANGQLISGIFSAMNQVPLTRVYRSFSDFQHDYEQAHKKNARPKVITSHNNRLQATYSAIWTKSDFIGHNTSHKMSMNGFNERFKKYYKTHLLSDYSLYTEGDKFWITGTWIKRHDDSGYGMYLNLTESEFNLKDSAMQQKGLKLVRIQRYQHPGKGERLSGLWVKTSGEYNLFSSLSKQEFIDLDRVLRQSGKNIHFVTSYNNKVDVIYKY